MSLRCTLASSVHRDVLSASLATRALASIALSREVASLASKRPALATSASIVHALQVPQQSASLIRQLPLYSLKWSAHYSVRSLITTSVSAGTRPQQQGKQSSSSSSSKPGLFKVLGLHQPQDFPRLAKEAVAKAHVLRELIRSSPPSLMTLQWTDDISDTLCRVADVAELCRTSHPDAAWRQAANDAWMTIYNEMSVLSSDSQMTMQLKGVGDDPKLAAQLNSEQKKFIQTMVARMGALLNLPQVAIDEYTRLMAKASELESEFTGISEDKWEDIRIEGRTLAPFRSLGSDSDLRALGIRYEHKGVVISLNKGNLALILRNVADAEIRKLVYNAGQRLFPEALLVLQELIATRQALATLLGYHSIAESGLAENVARHPEAVVAFLQKLSDSMLGLAKEEVRAIERVQMRAGVACGSKSFFGTMKDAASKALRLTTVGKPASTDAADAVAASSASSSASMCSASPSAMSSTSPSSSPSSSSSSFSSTTTTNTYTPTVLQAHDWLYHMGRVASTTLSVDDSTLANYLPLSAAMHGLGLIAYKTFGCRLILKPLQPGEGWHASSNASGSDRGDDARSSVMKLEAVDVVTQRVLGTVYLDLISRPNKFPGSVSFTVQCGRLPHDKPHDPPLDPATAPPSAYQLPVVAIVCNFPYRKGYLPAFAGPNVAPTNLPPEGVPLEEFTPGAPWNRTLLASDAAVTLFHEFGHALHTVLSRTQFQHLSGTRGEFDILETPSLLLELFASDPRVVGEFARHYSTGEPMPKDMLMNLSKVNQMTIATNIQKNISYGLLDQRLFGIPTPFPTSSSPSSSSTPTSSSLSPSDLAFPWLNGRKPRLFVERALPRGRIFRVTNPDGTKRDIPHLASSSPQSAAATTPLAAAAVAGVADDAETSPIIVDIPPPPSSQHPHASPAQTTLLAEQFSRLYDVYPLQKGAHPHGQFTHFSHYGAGYYTYVYSSVFARAIWNKCFAKNPFNREEGMMYRNEFLYHGGCRDPLDMFSTLLKTDSVVAVTPAAAATTTRAAAVTDGTKSNSNSDRVTASVTDAVTDSASAAALARQQAHEHMIEEAIRTFTEDVTNEVKDTVRRIEKCYKL